LLIFNAKGINWLPKSLDIFNDWASLISLVILSIIYTLGIFVDRLAIGFFSIINPKKLIQKSSWLRKTVTTASENYYFPILVHEKKATEVINSNRIKIRIVRSTVVSETLCK
jgi:hypothetical protein